MAGYNTVAELMRAHKPALLVPRVRPISEQLLRARELAPRAPGRAAPDDLWPATMRAALERLLDRPAPAFDEEQFRGTERTADLLAGLVDPAAADRPSPQPRDPDGGHRRVRRQGVSAPVGDVRRQRDLSRGAGRDPAPALRAEAGRGARAGAPTHGRRRIQAQPNYLPATTSLSGVSRVRWLARNLPAFLPALRRTARRRPLGLLRACAAALADAVRARRLWWALPRKVFLRELLLGVALADRLLTAGDVGHLHAHFAHGTTTVTWYASRITGVPFSFTGHARDIYTESLNPGGLLRRKLRAARFVVTCTEANRRHLEQIAGDASVHRVYHGLNAEFADLLAAGGAVPQPNGRFRVLAVGRLVAKKGFDVLVEALALLADRGVPVEALIVGHTAPLEPEVGPQLERAIADHGLDGPGPARRAR